MATLKPYRSGSNDEVAATGHPRLYDTERGTVSPRAFRLAIAFQMRLGMEYRRAIQLANYLQSSPDLEKIEDGMPVLSDEEQRKNSIKNLENFHKQLGHDWIEATSNLIKNEAPEWEKQLREKYDLPFEELFLNWYPDYLANSVVAGADRSKDSNTSYEKVQIYTEFELQKFRKDINWDDLNDEVGVSISDKSTSFKLSFHDKLDVLDRFCAEQPGEPIRAKLLELFPHLDNPENLGEPLADLPNLAPQLWTSDNKMGETPAGFILRVYEPWIGKGLTRADIRQLDRPLYNDLKNWLRTHKPPSGFDLPTRREYNDRLLAELGGRQHPLPTLAAGEDLSDARVLNRLASARRYRDQKSGRE